MNKPADLREQMVMPDPFFPIKVHVCKYDGNGRELFAHHWHHHIELLYFTSGEALIECNSIPIYVREGELVVVNTNDIHYGMSMSDALSYYAIIADLSIIQSLSADAVEMKYIVPITQNRILFRNHVPCDKEMNECLEALVNELMGQQAGFELSVKSYLYRILAILMREHASQLHHSSDYETRVWNLQRLTPVFRHIENHYQEEILVSQLADLAGLSRFHFSRLFKSLTGRTITEYVNMIRVNKSEYLLKNTSMSVSEIALATGYNDIYYYSRMFKKLKNISPSELRRNKKR